jgi:phosphoglucomutase
LQEAKDLTTGKVTPIQLPKSDVLQFFTESGSKITVRPSGTEPKIKFYFSMNEPLEKLGELHGVEQELNENLDELAKLFTEPQQA